MGKSRRLSRASVEELTFDENDDEAERDALRAARDAEVARVKSPHAAKPGQPAGADPKDGPSGPAAWSEIAEVYADCIKICNDNVRAAARGARRARHMPDASDAHRSTRPWTLAPDPPCRRPRPPPTKTLRARRK